jgi:hypothetical protein
MKAPFNKHDEHRNKRTERQSLPSYVTGRKKP